MPLRLFCNSCAYSIKWEDSFVLIARCIPKLSLHWTVAYVSSRHSCFAFQSRKLSGIKRVEYCLYLLARLFARCICPPLRPPVHCRHITSSHTAKTCLSLITPKIIKYSFNFAGGNEVDKHEPRTLTTKSLYSVLSNVDISAVCYCIFDNFIDVATKSFTILYSVRYCEEWMLKGDRRLSLYSRTFSRWEPRSPLHSATIYDLNVWVRSFIFPGTKYKLILYIQWVVLRSAINLRTRALARCDVVYK